jgi:hypothetical protein
MLSVQAASIAVKTSLLDNLIHISVNDGTNHIYFEALNHTSQIKEMLILAGQALASNSGPVMIEYDTINGLNLFMGIIVTLA